MNSNWGWVALAVVGIMALSNVANNPRVNPNLRFVARTAEGDLIQDLETGFIHLLPFSA